MVSASSVQAVARNESIYRYYRGRPAPVHGCGFVLKPTVAGGYANRLMPDRMVVVYVLRGEGVFEDWHGRSHVVAAGDFILMPAGRRHGVQQRGDGQWAEAFVTMDGRFGQHLHRLGVIDVGQPVLHPGVEPALVERFRHILDDLTHVPDYSLPSVLSLAHELLTAAVRLHRRQLVPDRQHRAIESACVLLSQHLEKRGEIEEIAANLGMSYERFRKLFRQRVGMSPGDYRIRRRIDRARALIGEHGLSNKQVAYELGYPDPFTFSKQFHKVTGEWPEELRRGRAEGAVGKAGE